MKTVVLKMIMDEVTIDFNVLGALMKNIIKGNVNGTTIAIVNRGTGGLRSTHIGQEPIKPKKLKSSIGQSTVLSCGTGVSNNRLFLAMPRYKRGA